MGRTIAGAFFLLGCAGYVAGLVALLDGWSPSQWRQRRKVDRRQIIIDEEIQENARDMYAEWELSVRAMQRVLDGDAVTLWLPEPLRDELLERVGKFYGRQRKGSK